MTLYKLIKNDFLFMFKYKIYHVYFFLLLSYIFILYILEGEIYEYAKVLIILSDPLVLGFFFIGGIFLIEMNEGLIKYDFITAIKPVDYIISKTVVLATSSTIIALILSLTKTINFNFMTMITIFIASSLMTLFGQFIVFKCKSVNDYLAKSVIYAVFLIAPLILSLIFDKIAILKFNPMSLIYLSIFEGYFNGYSYNFLNTFVLVGYLIIMFFITLNAFKKNLYGGKI